ncbi:hypothetical protein BGZ95_010467, partial [Linnemannia exigua]
MSKKSHTPNPQQSSPRHMGDLISSDHLVGQELESIGDHKSVSSRGIRKHDRFLSLFRSTSAEPKVNVKPQNSSPKVAAHRLSTTSTTASVHRISTVTTHDNIEIEHAVINTAVQSPVTKPDPSTLSIEPFRDIFTRNIDKPAVRDPFPALGTRINTNPQPALSLDLLLKYGDATEPQPNLLQNFPSETVAQIAWVKAVKQHPIEQDYIRWLGTCMVEEFAKDPLKDSTEMAEMVLLGPVLDKETYRRLLSCVIAAFEQAVLLDVNHLQGLVQLIQSAPSESLLPDDLVKILRIFRLRLQDNHQQTSVHPFHLTLAVSRVLDVMADHGVEGVRRVEEHEPLSGVLSGLKGSSDPYL